jgi:hypothetical protein
MHTILGEGDVTVRQRLLDGGEDSPMQTKSAEEEPAPHVFISMFKTSENFEGSSDVSFSSNYGSLMRTTDVVCGIAIACMLLLIFYLSGGVKFGNA